MPGLTGLRLRILRLAVLGLAVLWLRVLRLAVLRVAELRLRILRLTVGGLAVGRVLRLGRRNGADRSASGDWPWRRDERRSEGFRSAHCLAARE